VPRSAERIEKALTGNYRAEHLFTLEQALALYDAYHEKASACDARAALFALLGKDIVTATARKIAVLFYNAVCHGMEYVDPGAAFYETHYRRRVVANLHRRAKAFGFVLQPLEPKAGVAVS
jgi:hypothetical protein